MVVDAPFFRAGLTGGLGSPRGPMGSHCRIAVLLAALRLAGACPGGPVARFPGLTVKLYRRR